MFALTRKLVAVTGFLVFSSSYLLVAPAHAFGPQWRPVPGVAPLHLRPYQRVANVPAFRPRPTGARAVAGYPNIGPQPVGPGYGSYAQAMPMAMPVPAPYGHPYPGYPVPSMTSSVPAWAAPFSGMAQALK